MALDPTEIIVIGVVVLALLLWGPNKIPELARAFGRAKREYEKAASEVEREINYIAQLPAAPAAAPVSAVSNSSFKLIEVARTLGITTEGKTSDQIANEIIAKNNA